MFREASIYALKRLSDQERVSYGLRVLTMRTWPRGISKRDVDLWIPDAAPSPELLSAWRAGRVTWSDFAVAYRASQTSAQTCRVLNYQDQPQPLVAIYQCRALDLLCRLKQEYSVISLLCWESGPPCHRFLLKEYVESPTVGDASKAEQERLHRVCLGEGRPQRR